MTPAPHNFSDVHGLMTAGDLIWLRNHARGRCVELGSLEGLSALAIAGARAVQFVICIDVWTSAERFEAFLRNTEGYPIIPLRGSSLALANLFPDGYFDFCFIDTDHTRETTSQEIKTWLPKLRRGGVLCGHDINFPGVIDAVKAELPWYHEEAFDSIDLKRPPSPLPFSGIWSHTKQ